MRHRVAGVKLGRTVAHRRALFRNLVTALIERETVRTTDAKAKELRRWGDRMITLGKAGTLHARRRAATVIARASVLKKLFEDVAPRYATRHGGYTRVVKLGTRPGDAAPLSMVSLVERGGTPDEAGKKKPPRRDRSKGERGKGERGKAGGAAAEPKKRRRAAG